MTDTITQMQENVDKILKIAEESEKRRKKEKLLMQGMIIGLLLGLAFVIFVAAGAA